MVALPPSPIVFLNFLNLRRKKIFEIPGSTAFSSGQMGHRASRRGTSGEKHSQKILEISINRSNANFGSLFLQVQLPDYNLHLYLSSTDHGGLLLKNGEVTILQSMETFIL